MNGNLPKYRFYLCLAVFFLPLAFSCPIICSQQAGTATNTIFAAGWGKGALVTGGDWVLRIIDDSSSGADGVRLADVDGDGLMDVTTGWEQGGITRAYLNPGYRKSKKEWPAVTVGPAPNVEDAVFIDLDGDGALDIVTSCEGDTKKIFVHWAPADLEDYLDPNSWQTEVLPASDGVMKWMFAAPLDVDGKNGIDIVAGGKPGNSRIGWFESPADPKALADFKWHPVADVAWVMSIIINDMDGDGDEDIAYSHRNDALSGCRWLENPGVGPALYQPWANHAIGAIGRPCTFMKFGDLDGDGLEDVVVPAREEEFMFIKRLDATGLNWSEHEIKVPADSGKGKAAAIGDINKDGKIDIVYSCASASDMFGVGWISYDKSPTEYDWTHHDVSGKELGSKFDRLELLDLDGDGDLDIMTCEENEGDDSTGLGVIWYENPLN